MPFDYRASAALTFTSNGAALFDRLTKASEKLAAAGEKLDAVLAKINATLGALDETVATTTAGMADLTAAFREAAGAAGAADAASRSAAAGFASAAAAAAAARGATARQDAAAAAGVAAAARRVPRATAPAAAAIVADQRLSSAAQTLEPRIPAEPSAIPAPPPLLALPSGERGALEPRIPAEPIERVPVEARPLQVATAAAAAESAAAGGGGGFIPPTTRGAAGSGGPVPFIPTARAVPGSGGPVPPGGGGRGGGGGFGGGFAAGALGGVPGLVEHAAKIGLEIGAGTGIDAVYEATKLQRALIGVKNATGATDAQIDALRQKAYDVGDQTGVSAVKAADMFAVMARSSGGVFTDKSGGFDMAGFMQIAPTMAKIAQIQNLTRGVSLDSAAQTVMQLAHLFHTYSGESFNQVGDQLTRLSEMMPDSLQVAMRQMTYFAPQFKALGISNQDTIATMALLDRLGYGRGKGGTNMSDLIAASLGGLQLTQHAQAGKDALLEKFGVVDAAGKSKFFTDKGADLIGFLEQLHTYASKHGRIETVQEYKSAFGVQGGRIADLAMDPQFAQQLQKIERVMQNPNISLDEQWTRYFGSAGTQMHRAFSNFQSDMTELGWLALPGVTKAAKDLGDALHGAQTWMHANKELEESVTRYIVSRVGETEDFLKAHGDDFRMLGEDAITAFKAIDGLAHGIAALAGAALSTYGTIHRVIDLLLKLDPFKKPATVDNGVLSPAARDAAADHLRTLTGNTIGPRRLDPIEAIRHALGMDGPMTTAAPPARARALGEERERTRDVVHHHHYAIHVDARGANDPKAVERAAHAGAKAAIDKALQKGDPRSTLALAGTGIRTHALIPAAVSVQGA